MSRDYSLFLKDILASVVRIKSYTRDFDFESFESNELVIDGVLHYLMIIGEAVKNIPENIQEKTPSISWREIGRFRDLVIHHYFGLDLTIVRDIIQNHITPLEQSIESPVQVLEEQTTSDND